MYNTHTLDNGLRIIQRPSDEEVVYLGYAIKAGTRDEQPGEEGLAHFCEHATFKGTERRKAWQVIQTIDGVGGELNAFTNKEATVYYCAILREHLPKAIDLLTDIVFHSVYPDKELEKEKDVICDEIESYNDSPAELIYDDFDNILFAGHPLGHNILGTKESVKSFTSEDAKRFTNTYYRPDNAIFFIDGCQSPQSPLPTSPGGGAFKLLLPIIRLIEKAFAKYPVRNISHSPYQQDISKISSPRGGREGAVLHQSHIMLGGLAYDIHHPRRIALYLLNNILGGPAMSSRLNMALRERNGLVYTVESTMVSYGDCGSWSIYFGCDHHDVKRCMRLIRHELDTLMNKPLSPRQLAIAKKQIKGQIALACDSRENFTLDFAKSFLHYGWEKDVTALYSSIDALTSADLQAVAQELFPAEKIKVLNY